MVNDQRDLLKMVMMKMAPTDLEEVTEFEQGTEHSTQRAVHKFTLNKTSLSLRIFHITLMCMSLQSFPFKEVGKHESGKGKLRRC